MSPRRNYVIASLLLVLCIFAAPIHAAAPHADGAPAASRITRLVVHDSPARARGNDHAKSAHPATTARSRHDREPAHATGRDDRRSALRVLAMQEHARQRQQAQIDARAAHIYALSQTNAPILDDTRACKRSGAHGESIYENCAVAGGDHR